MGGCLGDGVGLNPIRKPLGHLQCAAFTCFEVSQEPIVPNGQPAQRSWGEVSRLRLLFNQFDEFSLCHIWLMGIIIPLCQGTIVALRKLMVGDIFP